MLEPFCLIAKDLYQKYRYANIDTLEYQKMVEETSFTIDDVSLNSKDVNEKFTAKLIEKINFYLSNKISEETTFLNLCNHFISENITFPNDYEEACIYLAGMPDFLKGYSFTSTVELLYSLISSNQVIFSVLETIVSNHQKNVEDGKIDKINSDEVAISMIYVYCDIEDIEIKDEEDIEKDNFFLSSDSARDYLKEIYLWQV